MKLKNQKKPKDENDLFFFAKMNATSLAAFTLVIFLICFVGFYSAGLARGRTIATEEVEISAGATYQTSVSQCIVYTDEVVISEDNCTQHVDCTPNGICVQELEKCAYFVN